ncbi:MAG: extracellular solute-binding protein [Clostridiales bacterium]|nr:extracellular solute-binding protein [Clostridiales bacterium]
MKYFSKTKIGSLVLAFLMICLLPSCGGETGKSGSTSSAEEEKIDLTKDMGNYDFVFASHWAASVFPEKGSSATADLIWKRVEEIQTRNNCKISYKGGTPEEYLQNMQVASASGVKYADVVLTNLWWYRGYQDTDYFVPWNDIEGINIDASKWIPSITKVATELDGKTYGLDFHSWPDRMLDISNTMFFNKNLLEKYNQPDPYELAEKGEWTWENLRTICKNLTKDLDGDKQNDIWGLISNDRVLEYSAIRSNGCFEVEVDNKGLYTVGFQNEKAYKAMEFVRDLIHVDRVAYEKNELASFPIFKEGRAGFVSIGSVATRWKGYLSEMEDDYGFIWFPQGPDNQGGKYYGSSLSGDSQVFCITQGADDPQKAGYIFNLLTEPLEGKSVDSWKDYALKNYFRNDKQAFDNYLMLRDTAVFDYGPILGYGSYNSLRDAIYSVTRDQAMTPAQAMESVTGSINEQLKERWELTVNAES